MPLSTQIALAALKHSRCTIASIRVRTAAETAVAKKQGVADFAFVAQTVATSKPADVTIQSRCAKIPGEHQMIRTRTPSLSRPICRLRLNTDSICLYFHRRIAAKGKQRQQQSAYSRNNILIHHIIISTYGTQK